MSEKDFCLTNLQIFRINQENVCINRINQSKLHILMLAVILMAIIITFWSSYYNFYPHEYSESHMFLSFLIFILLVTLFCMICIIY